MILRSHPVLVSLVLAAPLFAQGSILPYLPKDTMMAVSAPDLATSMAEFQQMPLAKMWGEQEVQNFVADVKELAGKKIEELLAQGKEMHAQGALPVDPAELLKLRLHGMSFAVTNLELAVGDHGPLPKFGLVLHLDFGDTAPQWKSLIDLGLEALKGEAGENLVATDTTIGDVKIMTLAPNNPPGLEMGLNVAMVGNGILVGTLASDIKGIVENLQKKTPVLGATPAYLATAKHLKTDGAEVESFMRLDPMVTATLGMLRVGLQMAPNRQAREIDMDGIERAVEAMGLRKLGTTAGTANYENGRCVTRSFMTTGESTTTPASTIDMGFLKWVPKDAVGFSAGTWNIASIYDSLLAGVKAYDENIAKQALEHLAAMEGELGFTIRNDLFGSIGNHYITWSMPMGTITSAPEVAFLVKINDEEKITRVLKNLAKLTDGKVEIEEGEKRGLKAYQVRVNVDPMEGMGMNPFDVITPTFAFKNGYMVVGFSASDVKRVFQRMDREDDPKGDIRGNKEFAAVAGQLPTSLESVSFTDSKAQFESFYQIATGLLAFVPMGEDVPIDMSLLPDSGTLTKHLYGSFSYSTAVEGGTEMVASSPFGPETWMAIGLAAGAAGATFGLMGRRGF